MFDYIAVFFEFTEPLFNAIVAMPPNLLKNRKNTPCRASNRRQIAFFSLMQSPT